MRHLAVAFVLLYASVSAAHDFWIVPSSFHPEPGSILQARLFVGMNLQGEPVPRHAPWIQRFALTGSGVETPMVGREGSVPAGLIAAPGPGLHFLVYQSTGNPLDLEPAKFELSLREEGLEKIIDLRAARGESQKPSHELFYRCAKSLVQVGAAGGQGFDRILGLTLEIVPEADPYSLPVGGSLPVRLLYEGQPLAGALLMALNPEDPDQPLKLRSDAAGRAVFTLPRPGLWLIKAVEMIPARAGKDADWESFWASLTFQLGP